MKKQDLKITFVFQRARNSRINEGIPFAKDMFYTFFSFKEEYETEIIEFGDFPAGRVYKIIFHLERYLRTLLKIPLYSLYLTNKKNYKILSNSDHVILSTNRIATSLVPMMLVMKLLNKKVKFTFFVLGIFSSKPRFFILRILQSIFYSLLYYLSDNIIFIGEGEYQHAKENTIFFKNKFIYIPFGIDTKFWKSQEVKSFKNKKEILFVGNDSNRDFTLVNKIAEHLPGYDFIFVTSKINKKDVSKNVKLYSGSWGNPALTDSELKSLYEKSRLTIIPLNDSLQPSGQSVALQSMMVGTPVLITKTSGLWDKTKLVGNDNIFFLNDNSVNTWVDKIDSLYNRDDELIRISRESTKTIAESFSIDLFYQNIKKVIKI
jgi:glycosyltransferase involved in cell wall biosynthesis